MDFKIIRFAFLPKYKVSEIQCNSFFRAEPSLAYRPFHLMTVYPSKLIDDEEVTVKDAGLLNATLQVKFEN